MVNNILTALIEMARFASIYCFSKCMKTLLCGLCLIPLILLIHRALRKKSAVLSCYLWLLLVPMAFMGMSRLFYQKYFVYVTVFLAGHIKAWHGYVYFGVMLVLAADLIVKTVRLRRKLRKLPQINDTYVINHSSNTGTLERKYLEKVRIYLSDTNESPFSGGIIKPYIVVPEGIWRSLDKKGKDIILCHELMHIRSGHIILLTVFKLLTFLWWINPFIYRCEGMLRDDIELACDECTIAAAGVTGYEYGSVLLCMAAHLTGKSDVATASFLNRSDFHILKKRIQYIGRKRTDSDGFSRQRRVGGAALLGIAAFVLMLILITSYPRYTIIEEIYVYDEDIKLIAYDTPAIYDAFRIENAELRIDEEGFKRFLKEEDISGDYVYVSFGTVMKLPGMGGCGDVVMVNVEDITDTWNLSADTIENVILEIFLKYVI